MKVRGAAATCTLLLVTACSNDQPSVPVFGRHFPVGDLAVAHAYATLWRPIDGLRSVAGFYDHCSPADRAAALAYAARLPHTSPDVNCMLLGDVDQNETVANDHPTGLAFHEHAGESPWAPPFYQFWYDDNWLARVMARAYGAAEPAGLYDADVATRWRVLMGDNAGWVPQGEQPDQVALSGMFWLNIGRVDAALAEWGRLRDLRIRETYHLALWLILSERLYTATKDHGVLQRAMMLRQELLSLREPGGGWRTGIHDPRTLVNIETLALCVLALGAEARLTVKPGGPPLPAGEVEVTTWNGVSWERSVVPAALSVPNVVLVRVLN